MIQLFDLILQDDVNSGRLCIIMIISSSIVLHYKNSCQTHEASFVTKSVTIHILETKFQRKI